MCEVPRWNHKMTDENMAIKSNSKGRFGIKQNRNLELRI